MSDEIVVQDGLSALERIAKDPTVDAGKLTVLYELMARERADRRQQEFNSAMVAIGNEVRTVFKNKANTHTKSKYADLEEIEATVEPVRSAQGISISFSQEECAIPDTVKLVATIRHAGGHVEKSTVLVPVDGSGIKGNTNKTATQALGSTLTYARRYAITLIFNLISSETPADRDGATEPEADAVDWRAEAAREFEIDNLTDAQKDFVFKWAGCTGFQDMTQAQARTIAEARRAKRASKRADAAAAAGKGGEHG